MSWRVAVGGIEHETTSFIPEPTLLEDFARQTVSGDQLARLADANTIVDGFVKGVRQCGLELVPLSWESLPSGVEFLDVEMGDRTVSHGVLTVRFSPLGTATAHAVHLKGAGEDRMTVTVNPLTGLVAIVPKVQNLDLFADESEFAGSLSKSGFR